MSEWTHPAYPEKLTKAYWDKKKSVIAKMAGETGVGETMLKVRQLYDAVNWDCIEIGKHLPKGNEFTKAAWAKQRDDAYAEISGNLTKLSMGLYKLRDVCQKAEAAFKKSKTIPKSDTALAADIATTADQLGVQLNKNSMNPIVQARWQDFQSAYDNMVASLQKNIKGAVAKAETKIKTMVSDPTVTTFNAQITSAARDITQSIGNVPRFITAGYNLGIDASEAARLFKTMTDWANKTPYFSGPTKPEDVKNEIAAFAKAVQACKKLAE